MILYFHGPLSPFFSLYFFLPLFLSLLPPPLCPPFPDRFPLPPSSSIHEFEYITSSNFITTAMYYAMAVRTLIMIIFCIIILLASSFLHSQGQNLPPAPPPSSDLQPSDFPNLKQYLAYVVIQLFKRTITCDPNNVTATWVGNQLCTYQGFYCQGPPDSPTTPTIASIDFNGFRLCAPTLAGFLDQLPDLALFHANSNNFSGTIPDLTGLQYLYELDVSNQNLGGPFPANVLPLTNLVFLDLRYNLFAGAVPASIFNLDFEVFFINNNFFNQPLPSDLWSSPVSYLSLANNGFTGPIPKSIANASDTLIEVLFLNNKLSGCLPYEIGLLRQATVFDVGFNQFTGPIPWSFGCLLKVEQLNLAGNLLYGQVPEVVCQLAKDGNLANLSLSGNYFTSIGHSCWELIKSKVLDVRKNCIPWLPEQRSPAECARFLLHPKYYYCPVLHYIPCSLPKCSPPPASPRTTAAPPGYKGYHAIHNPSRKN